MVSDKLSSVLSAIDRARASHVAHDPVLLESIRNVLIDCLDQTRALEHGLCAPMVQVGPIDCVHVSMVARLHLAGMRAATHHDVEAMAAVAIVHHRSTCEASQLKKGARS
jgi:hypothetical protein